MNKIKKAYEFLKFKLEAVGRKERVEGNISQTVKDTITKCITNRFQIGFTYLGDQTALPGYYISVPMVWGLNKYTKNNILRAYVMSGGDFDGWVTFRLDRIRSPFLLKNKSFDIAPPGYNPSGDGLMSEELLKVDFLNKS